MQSASLIGGSRLPAMLDQDIRALDLVIACVNGKGRPVRIPGPVRDAFDRAAGAA